MGFWCNNMALYAYIINQRAVLGILGDVLPFELSIGDCFLFVGYGLGAVLLGLSISKGIWKLKH